MENSIVTQTYEGITTITINRPDALNAINKQVMIELHTFFAEHSGDKSILGVVITGGGEKAFAAGADIKEFLTLTDQQASAMSAFGHETYNSIESFHAPVIAAVNGFALGGGCELAMACHIRIASDRAKFGMPESKLGLIPGYGGIARLVRYVGRGRALEILMSGENIDANEAYRIGLVNAVVQGGEEVSTATNMIKKIAKNGPAAVTNLIRLVNMVSKDQDVMEEEIKYFGAAMASDEALEGVDAFVNKRAANFRIN